jgi:hypothetical protein
MRRIAFPGLCLAALCARAAQAQPVAPARPTNLPGVTTSAEPPAPFDALGASEAELNAYGFPPRPDQTRDAAGYETWSRALAAHPRRLAPTLQRTVIYHGPRVASARPATVDGATSSNWSGYAADTGARTWSNASFSTVAADFVVPAVTARTCDSTWEYSSVWVGIDGYASDDVLQAGVEADALCVGGYAETYYTPWYEWYPNASTRITNLAATPGQSFYIHVWATSPTAGHAYIQNLGSNQSVSLNFNAPSGTTLRGESAEWILESPSVNGSLATLPLYGLDYFSAASSTTLGKNVFAPSSVGATAITLLRGGVTYSAVGPLGPRGIQFTSQ